MKLIFATGNLNKLREIRQIFDLPGVEILSMKEAGVDTDVEEDGTTFQDNALIKARAIHRITGDLVLADDSGLVIDAWPYTEPGKALGVYSARFMGHDTSYDLKLQEILRVMKDVPEEERTARFVCAVAAVLPDGSELCVTGNMEGRIGYEISGENGFGYDPIFFLPEYGKTSADISPEEKNAISHRGKALRKMKEILEKLMKSGELK